MQAVDRVQPVEGVLAIEHARAVGVAILKHERAPAKLLVDCCATDEHRVVAAAGRQLLHQERHLLAGAYQQGGDADHVGVVLLGGVDDGRDRHLTAQVVHGVAVVLEDGAHQVLADVVYVAVHGGQHHGALGVALHLVEELLQVGHALLHHLGALQHVRQDELPAAKAVANFLHGRQQHRVEQLNRRVVGAPAALVEGCVDVGLNAFGHPVKDSLKDHLVGRHVLKAGGGVGGLLGFHTLVPLDEPGQGILAAPKDEVVGHLHFVGRDLAHGPDVGGVDHGQVEAGGNGTGKKHAVERGARGGPQAKRHIGDAKAGEHARKVLLNEADALNSGCAREAVLLLAGGQRKGEGVKDETARVEAVLAAHDVVNLGGDAQLLFAGFGHADHVINGQRHHGCAMLFDDGHHLVDLHPTVLHVDGVDDGAAGIGGKGGLNGVGLGAVDHERGLNAHRQLLGEDGDLIGFVNALGEGHAYIQHVGAKLHLLAGDRKRAGVVVGEDHLFDLAAALRVDPLAHDGGAGLLPDVNGAHGAGDARRVGHDRALVRGHILQCIDDGADVVGGTSAAAAHHVWAEVGNHRGDLLGHAVGVQVVVRHAAHVARQAGVWHHRDGLGGVRAHVRHRLAQVLGAHGAVGADHIDAHPLKDGDHGAHVGAEQHAAGLVEGDLGLNGN